LRSTPLPNDPVIEVLQHELGKVKDEVEQLKQARDERNEQIRHLQEQLNEAQEKYHLSIGTVREEVTTLSETVDHLRRELEKTRRERDGYAKEVRDLQDKEARLNDELHNERISRRKFIQEGAEKDLNAEQERNRLLGIIEELSRQKTIPKERRPAENVIQQQREPQRAWLELDPLDLSSIYLAPLEEETGESAQQFQPKKLERKFRKTQMYTGSRANMTVRKWRKSHDTFNLPGGTFVLG
jgi:chromosome segregation ATPase